MTMTRLKRIKLYWKGEILKASDTTCGGAR